MRQAVVIQSLLTQPVSTSHSLAAANSLLFYIMCICCYKSMQVPCEQKFNASAEDAHTNTLPKQLSSNLQTPYFSWW